MSLISSIRFRFSLAVAVTVFAVGAFFIGAIYLWQVDRLDPPVIETRQLTYVDPVTEREVETVYQLVFSEDVQVAVAIGIEQHAYRQALSHLRTASFYALALLALTSFATGWVVSGWTLGPVHRMAAVARDISANDLSRRIALRGPDDELKGLADTFDDMVDRLQAAFEDQRRLVHDTSHELRNPLAVSRANLELALDSDDPDELRRAASVSLGANERMSALVDEMLERARDGVPDVDLAEVDLASLARSVTEEHGAAARAAGVRLGVVAVGAPVVVLGEASALRRAIANLVDNALRFAPPGSEVTVTIGAEDGRAVVTVADRGPGIASEDLGRVFDRFWRGNDAGAGTGLGLSIVERIVTRHGGRVAVDSTPGDGARFRIELPEHRTPLVAAATTETGAETESERV